MSELPSNPQYDLHVVIPAETLHEAIEAISHLSGVVFQVTIREDKPKLVTR